MTQITTLTRKVSQDFLVVIDVIIFLPGKHRNSCIMLKHQRLRKKLEKYSSGNLEENNDKYRTTIKDYIRACDANPIVKEYDFSSLVLINISFHKQKFKKKANFYETSFIGKTSFSRCAFKQDVDFSRTSFAGQARFNEASFAGTAHFNEASFAQFANFSQSTFDKEAYFLASIFAKESWFNEISFGADVNFSEAVFKGSTGFGKTKFSSSVEFYDSSFEGRSYFDETIFAGRTEFYCCNFHDEISFEGARFAFIKLPPERAGNNEIKPIHLEGAVLKSVHLWGINSLNSYFFKYAFILGVSLAGKKLINCDFTGAVMKQVFTDGWELDEDTIQNTKYIYTDYRKETKEEDGGNTSEVYVFVPESRVPADGNFGEGSNEGFTIKDYFYRPFEWNYALDLPPELRTTILNVVQFFREYAEKAKNEHVEIATRPEGNRLRVIFQIESESDRERVEGIFKDYIEKLFSVEDFVVEFENPTLEEIEKAELQRRITLLQNLTLIETVHQMQLAPDTLEQFERFLQPILLAENRIMDYSVRLLDKAGQIGAKQIITSASSHAHASATATAINKTEVTLKLVDFIDELESASIELGQRKVKHLQDELEDVIKDVRADPAQAKAAGRLPGRA